MKAKRIFCFLTVFLIIAGIFASPVFAKKKNPLDAWKPKFDYKRAKYRAIVSNISHPVIKGIYAGFAIRDELWKRSKGKIYFDFRPLAVLGGEVEVLNQLQMGAIQGMAVSSVAATNLGPRFGIVNLPFLVDSFDKLDRFVASGRLFNHFMMAMDHQGIMALDITGYGNYGWCTTKPVRTIADARKLKFRIAEAAVNKLNYKNWGFNPVVMPWPDVPVALRQGVIDALDHAPTVCNITRKYEIAKHHIQLNYAQGLFIWIFNKAWFNRLPADLQQTFKDVIHEVAAEYRHRSRLQEAEQIAKAKAKGITFTRLSNSDMAILRRLGNATHEKYRATINELHDGDTYRPANYLKEVQWYMEYKP